MQQLDYYELHLCHSGERLQKTLDNLEYVTGQMQVRPLSTGNADVMRQIELERAAIERILSERGLF